MRCGTVLVVFSLLAACASAQELRKERQVQGQPYTKYTVGDKYHRIINLYLSDTDKKEPQPLVVFIQGSGFASLFGSQDGRTFPQMGHGTVVDVFEKAARVLIVEKPGVTFLDPGNGPVMTAAPPAFLEEHTLERWTVALETAIQAVENLPEIDKSHILVIGHSEGGLVACKIAHDLPEVTHVATLAGGCMNQLYDLLELVRKGYFYKEESPDPEERVKKFWADVKQMLSTPTRTDVGFLGHPYLRWSTFLSSSPLEELQTVKSRIYIGQGSEDTAVDPSSADALYCQLLLRNKDVTLDYVQGADHSFHIAQGNKDGWKDLMLRISFWFLAPTKTNQT